MGLSSEQLEQPIVVNDESNDQEEQVTEENK